MDKLKVPVTHESVVSAQKTKTIPVTDQDSDDSCDSLNVKVKEECGSSDDEIRNSQPKRKRDIITENGTEPNNKRQKRAAVTYSMLLTNFPKNLTCHEINKFISLFLEGIPVKMQPEIADNKQGLRLSFTSVNQWLTAQEKLKDVQLGDTKLKVKIEGPPCDSDSESSQTTEIISAQPQDIWESDDKGLYGLKPEFLARLHITPPIGKWVHIANFRCDKSELRDACELAGNVVVCSVVNNPYKYAKVMYSHPLEAVQAVSMLHDQVFYGQKLIVKMETTTNMELMLPKGLTNVGPGLGIDGCPVRDITREYEKFVKGKGSTINLSLFKAGNIDEIVLPEIAKHTVSVDKMAVPILDIQPPETTPSVVKPASPNVAPVMVRSAVLIRPVRPAFGMNIQEPPRPYVNRNPVQVFRGQVPGPRPMVGPMVRPDIRPQYPSGYMPVPGGRMPMQFVQSVPGPIPAPISMNTPVPGVTQNWLNPQNTGLAPQMLKCPDPTTLKITNLPPTTSFPSLCGKLSALAQVTSLEFTTPGCAVAKFASPAEAEKCFQKTIGTFSFPETRRLVKYSTKLGYPEKGQDGRKEAVSFKFVAPVFYRHKTYRRIRGENELKS